VSHIHAGTITVDANGKSEEQADGEAVRLLHKHLRRVTPDSGAGGGKRFLSNR